MFRYALKTFVHKYRWIHLSIGLLGNTSFVVGSLMYLFEHSREVGTWFWLAGSVGMLLGRIGEAFAEGLDHHWRRLEAEAERR